MSFEKSPTILAPCCVELFTVQLVVACTAPLLRTMFFSVTFVSASLAL